LFLTLAAYPRLRSRYTWIGAPSNPYLLQLVLGAKKGWSSFQQDFIWGLRQNKEGLSLGSMRTWPKVLSFEVRLVRPILSPTVRESTSVPRKIACFCNLPWCPSVNSPQVVDVCLIASSLVLFLPIPPLSLPLLWCLCWLRPSYLSRCSSCFALATYALPLPIEIEQKPTIKGNNANNASYIRASALFLYLYYDLVISSLIQSSYSFLFSCHDLFYLVNSSFYQGKWNATNNNRVRDQQTKSNTQVKNRRRAKGRLWSVNAGQERWSFFAINAAVRVQSPLPSIVVLTWWQKTTLSRFVTALTWSRCSIFIKSPRGQEDRVTSY